MGDTFFSISSPDNHIIWLTRWRRTKGTRILSRRPAVEYKRLCNTLKRGIVMRKYFPSKTKNKMEVHFISSSSPSHFSLYSWWAQTVKADKFINSHTCKQHQTPSETESQYKKKPMSLWMYWFCIEEDDKASQKQPITTTSVLLCIRLLPLLVLKLSMFIRKRRLYRFIVWILTSILFLLLLFFFFC